MTAGMEGQSWVNTGSERAQAMTAYVRAFFRSINTRDFSCLIANAQEGGQQKMVEELYSAGVVNNIVRAILGRIDRGRSIDDQVNDYVQDATVVLIQITRQGRLDLTKSPGEIASYICLWIEQRVKRVARKDQRWRFSLADPSGDVENMPEATDELEPYLDEILSAEAIGPESCSDSRPCVPLPGPWTKAGTDDFFAFHLKKSERNILSIFGSS
jgi:hypothetical protein